MRRTKELPIRRFGQGIWHILQEHPQTPVVVCWIEGNWGSFFSYRHGPPTKNKKMDFWHTIDVAFESPQIVPKEILANHLQTRIYLMKKCTEARKRLGKEPVRICQVEVESESSAETDQINDPKTDQLHNAEESI